MIKVWRAHRIRSRHHRRRSVYTIIDRCPTSYGPWQQAGHCTQLLCVTCHDHILWLGRTRLLPLSRLHAQNCWDLTDRCGRRPLRAAGNIGRIACIRCEGRQTCSWQGEESLGTARWQRRSVLRCVWCWARGSAGVAGQGIAWSDIAWGSLYNWFRRRAHARALARVRIHTLMPKDSWSQERWR